MKDVKAFKGVNDNVNKVLKQLFDDVLEDRFNNPVHMFAIDIEEFLKSNKISDKELMIILTYLNVVYGFTFMTDEESMRNLGVTPNAKYLFLVEKGWRYVKNELYDIIGQQLNERIQCMSKSPFISRYGWVYVGEKE